MLLLKKKKKKKKTREPWGLVLLLEIFVGAITRRSFLCMFCDKNFARPRLYLAGKAGRKREREREKKDARARETRAHVYITGVDLHCWAYFLLEILCKTEPFCTNPSPVNRSFSLLNSFLLQYFINFLLVFLGPSMNKRSLLGFCLEYIDMKMVDFLSPPFLAF